VVYFFVVFDILLRYTETGSWKEAFLQAIPKRKQVQQGSNANEQLNADELTEGKQVETVNVFGLANTTARRCDVL